MGDIIRFQGEGLLFGISGLKKSFESSGVSMLVLVMVMGVVFTNS